MRQALSILAPLGWVYGFGASLRREAYARGLFRSERLRSPVISVGGLAMGGSMKTPVVMELARALKERGSAVGIIGHGYRGAHPGPRVASTGERTLETALTVGDEAMLLANELSGCPIVVGRDKAAAGRLLEERFGRRIILVDSGFQHLRLFRNLDIVCVSERDLNDRVLPAGMLRESVRALGSAGLLFTDRETDGPRVARLRGRRSGSVFSMVRTDFGFVSAADGERQVEPPSRAFAFCGVGRPDRFVADIRSRGVEVVGWRFFRDHHPYTDQDLREVAQAAGSAGALAVATTAKDAVRVGTWPKALPFLVLKSRLDVEDLPLVLEQIDRAILATSEVGLS